ncbi:hypothetical protein ACFL0Y_00170 [Patescibacteria group bacterium]
MPEGLPILSDISRTEEKGLVKVLQAMGTYRPTGQEYRVDGLAGFKNLLARSQAIVIHLPESNQLDKR